MSPVDEQLTPYSVKDLWRRLEQAFRAAGKDPERLTEDDLIPFEHFHTGGAGATNELLAFAGPVKPRRVLDIGGGLGGPARYLASHIGAFVVVAEFLSEFCLVGGQLNKLTGHADSVGFLRADGTNLPLLAGSFDLVWMQQAGMNIEDKAGLLGEIERVLIPGGHYAFQEILAGPNPGPLILPMAFAVDEGDYHLEPPDTTRERLRGLGLRELAFEDVTPTFTAFTRSRVDALVADGPPPIGPHLLSTGDAREIVPNMLRNIEDGRMAFVRGVYQKPA
jgi:sarcosine/dimethylglycine N-methyltransferase